MKTLTNILLIIFAIILLSTVGIIGFFYRMFFSIFTGYEFNKYLNKITVSLDQLGNVVSAGLLNDCLVKNIRPFGLEDDTISEILAKNKNNLTKLGLFLANILEKLDAGHLSEALKENENYE